VKLFAPVNLCKINTVQVAVFGGERSNFAQRVRVLHRYSQVGFIGLCPFQPEDQDQVLVSEREMHESLMNDCHGSKYSQTPHGR
jgi:hypothetical protein